MRMLLVEDELEMVAALKAVLSTKGVIVDHVATVADGREAAQWGVHDVIVLDRHLPDGDGMRLLGELRNAGCQTPVIMLTAHNESADRIEGLDNGADDYVGKPFNVDELLARIRAAARRSENFKSDRLEYAGICLKLQTFEVYVGAEQLLLPRREVLLLKSLLRRAGSTVLRETLDEALYGFTDAIQSNAIDSHVSRLRKKLTNAGAKAEIHSIRGVGYLLR